MRYARAAAFIVLLKVVIGILLLTPLLANAKGPSSAGTYEGVAQGGSSGKSSAVTVWVEDNGDTLRYTFYVARFDASFGAEGAKQGADGSGTVPLTVPLTVSSAGVKGRGQITLTPNGKMWAMTGAGRGNGFGYEGDASLTASRVSAGIVLPSVGDQLADMISSLTRGSPGDGDAAALTEASEYVDGVFLESLSPHFSPAQAGPLIVETRKLASTGLGLLVLIAAIIFA